MRMIVILVLVLLVWSQVAVAKIFVYGVSSDGVNYQTMPVQVPDNDWIRVDFSGHPIWLWGPNITSESYDEMLADMESLQPTEWAICKCDYGGEDAGTCQCGGTCAVNGSYGHDCDIAMPQP